MYATYNFICKILQRAICFIISFFFFICCGVPVRALYRLKTTQFFKL